MTRGDMAYLAHRDDVVRSVDRAVDRLLTDGNDPFSLALYLWVARIHGIVLVNGDGLAAWASTWVERSLVDGHVGRRKDTEVASAALAAMALRGIDALADIDAAVRAGIERASRCRA